MRTNTGKLFITLGLLSLIHAGYSAAQHRSFLRLTEQTFHHLPVDIILQTLVSLIVTICGVTSVAGHFKEIRATTELESKSFEAIGNRPSFYTFSHRGRVITSVYSQ